MRLRTATLAGLLLFAASFGLLAWANEPTDAPAIAGGTGIVIAGALLGLTFLAARWRDADGGGYVSTVVDQAGFYEELAAFDPTRDDAPGFEDAAAV